MPFKDYKEDFAKQGQAQGGVQAGKGMPGNNGVMGGNYSAASDKTKLEEEPSFFDNDSVGGVEGNQSTPKFPGKTLFVAKNITDVTFTNDPDAGADNVTNNFRRDTRTYWHYFSDQKEYKIRQAPQPIGQGQFMLGSEQLNVGVCFQKNGAAQDVSGESHYLPQLVERYKVYLQQGAVSLLNLKEENLWTDWVKSITTGGEDLDMCFKMNEANPNVPIDEALKESLSPLKTNIVTIETEYNYFNKKYEEVIDKALNNQEYDIDEKALPNLYSFMLSAENSTITGSNLQKAAFEEGGNFDVFRNHTTLANSLEDIDKEKIFFAKNTGKFDIKDAPINYYFDAWSKGLNALLNNPAEGTEFGQRYYEKIIFSDAAYGDILKYNNDADNFPMHIKMSLSTSPNNKFYRALKETKYSSLLLNYLNILEVPDAVSFVQQDGQVPFNDESPRSVWDLSSFFTKVLNGSLDEAEPPEDSIFLGETIPPEQLFAKENSLFNQLMSLALKSKIRTMSKNVHRNFEKIINGGVGYSETFFFEVQKWSSNVAGNPTELLQTFYLPNSGNKIVDFIDTQIIPNKFYTYRVWAHKIVIGTAMNITPVLGTTKDTKKEKSAEINVITRPVIKVVRMPYYNVQEAALPVGDAAPGNPPPHSTVMVTDDPPLPPEISWAPIIEEPGKMIFNVNDTIGEATMFPRFIGDGVDGIQMLYVLYMQLQNKLSLNQEQLKKTSLEKNKIRFSSDEISEFFEVYKMRKKPTSYSDFKDKMFTKLGGPNASFKYTFDFNEKNYFVFRSVDQRGKYSNLTDVYEIQFKENSGVSFPEVRIFNIEEENKKDLLQKQKSLTNNTKTGKKFIYVKPSYNQRVMYQKYEDTQVELESAYDLEDFSLGWTEQTVFRPDRKFKIRLKSKKTGKKIDFNVRFTRKHEKIITK